MSIYKINNYLFSPQYITIYQIVTDLIKLLMININVVDLNQILTLSWLKKK